MIATAASASIVVTDSVMIESVEDYDQRESCSYGTDGRLAIRLYEVYDYEMEDFVKYLKEEYSYSGDTVITKVYYPTGEDYILGGIMKSVVGSWAKGDEINIADNGTSKDTKYSYYENLSLDADGDLIGYNYRVRVTTDGEGNKEKYVKQEWDSESSKWNAIDSVVWSSYKDKEEHEAKAVTKFQYDFETEGWVVLEGDTAILIEDSKDQTIIWKSSHIEDYMDKGAITYKYEYYYDESGRLSQKWDKHNTPDMVEGYFVLDTIHLYTYSEAGLIVKEECFNYVTVGTSGEKRQDIMAIEWKYDAKERVVEEVTYRYDEYEEKLTPWEQTKYEYDAMGNLIEKSSYCGYWETEQDFTQVGDSYLYTYDADGNLVQKVEKKADMVNGYFSSVMTTKYKKLYEVSFEADGGKGEMEAVYVEGGKSYTFPECGFAAPEGKEFSMWTSNEGLFEAGEILESVGADIKARALWDMAEATSIETVEKEATEGTWYDMSGRKHATKPTQKGLYIRNGKKEIVK